MTLLASAAGAAPLFEKIDRTASDTAFLTVRGAATERANKLQSDLAPGAAQSWQIDLNLDALTRIEGLDGERAKARRGAPLSGHHLDLDIPQRGVPLRLRFDTVYQGFDGVISYAGIIEGDKGSLVAISVDKDEILGKIHHSEGYTYLIERDQSSGSYTLSIIDQILIPQVQKLHDDATFSEPASNVEMTASKPHGKVDTASPMSSSGEVRLLILYTPAAATANNISLMANNIISTFNQTLSLSGVDSSNYVTLADMRSIGNNLSTLGSRCTNEIVLDMRNRVGAFTNLDDWMEVAYADIALAIVTTEPSYSECYFGYGRLGGTAFLIPSQDYPDHPIPFSNTTDTYALADLTAIHEIGHVLNGGHETDCNKGTIPSYACGYAPAHCDWQTLMAGYGQCSFDFNEGPGQQPTVRIARWSNPNINYNGEPTGVAGAGPVGRNMALALDINMPHAATWKGIQAEPPPAPNPISVTPSLCYGFNTVEWTSQTGGVEYRLYQSTSSAFTNPGLIYSGPGTAAITNVSQTDGAVYLRAKACNSGGCSPYSSQVFALYYPGCM